MSEFEWKQKEGSEESSELKPTKKSSRKKWLQHKKHDKKPHTSIRQMIEELKAKKKADKEKDETQEEQTQLSKGQRIKAKFAARKHLKADEEGKPHHRRHSRSTKHHKESKEMKEEAKRLKEEAKELKKAAKKHEKMEDAAEKNEKIEEEASVEAIVESVEKVTELWDDVNVEEAVQQYESERDALRQERHVRDVEEVEDEATCHIIRTKAIFALSYLAVQKKSIVSHILMPIYFNREEDTQIRLSALTLLFASSPPRAFWERLALSTWFEPDDQMTHFIYTTITSLVSNKNANRRESTLHAEAVLPMMKPMRWVSYVSSNYLRAGYEEKTRLGYSTKTSFFPGFESFIPSNHYNSLHLQLGPWFSKLVEYSVSSKQADKFIDFLIGKSGNAASELRKIQDELKIEARATGQPELFIYGNLLDNYQRFFTINPTTVESFVENLLRRALFSPDDAQFSINYHKYLPIADTFIRIPSSMGLAYSLFGHARLFVSLKSAVSGAMDLTSQSVKLEGEIKPVVNFAAMHKMSVETPFSKSYPSAGVHMETSLALPGIVTLETDLKSGKVQAGWKFTGDNIRIARHSVVPFTSIRKVNDFRPTLLLEETLPIVLADEAKHHEDRFGESAFGLNFIRSVRGDLEAIRTPLAYSKDWFGALVFYMLPSTLKYRESNLYLDNANSETQNIKTFWSFAAKSNENVEPEPAADEDLFTKPLFSTVYGDKIKQQPYIESQDDDWTKAKFQRLFQKLNEPLGYTADLTVEFAAKPEAAKSRRYGTSFVYGIGDHGLSHRANFMMEKKVEQAEEASTEDNFVLCVELEANLPRPAVIRREDFVRDDLSRNASVKIGFGKSCTDDRKILITTKLTRGEEEIPSNLRSKWEDSHCAKQEMVGRGISEECVSTRRLASILNKGIINIQYNEMPSLVRNVTVKASNLFRYWMGPYMYDNQVEVANAENQIRIESIYYPIIGSMDLRVFKPKSNTFYHGIDVHPVAEVMLPFNPRLNAFRAVFGAPGLCMVDRDTVTTFDGFNYNASVSGCDKLITKDCSGRFQMAVLVRQEDNQKVVTALLDEKKIEIRPAEAKVIIDGAVEDLSDQQIRRVKNEEGQLIADIRTTRDGFIVLESPSHLIRVTANAEEVIVLGSPVHRGRLCGLCGSQTNNKADDLIGPDQCPLPADLMDAAFELKSPEGCSSSTTAEESQLLNEVQRQCIKKQSTSVFGLSDARPLLPESQQEILSVAIRSVNDVDDERNCTAARNKMIHRGHKRCFSTTAVTKCLEGCRPAATEDVKLGFHCVHSGPLSDQLKEDMFVRPLDELIGKDISTIQTLHVPSACVPVE